MTGHWADYSWCPAIVLASLMVIFLFDFGAERYVDKKYGYAHSHEHPNVERIITSAPGSGRSHNQLHSGDQDDQMHAAISAARQGKDLPSKDTDSEKNTLTPSLIDWEERSFRQQIAAFLILEFGVIFHSVIIGLVSLFLASSLPSSSNSN